MLTREKHQLSARTCIVCGGKRAKARLLRLVLNAANKVCLDQQQRCQGRGAYVCGQPECLARLKLSHLERAFRRSLPENDWSPAQMLVETFRSHDGDSELHALRLSTTASGPVHG